MPRKRKHTGHRWRVKPKLYLIQRKVRHQNRVKTFWPTYRYGKGV